MPSRTLEDKVEELLKLAATFTKNLDSLQKDVDRVSSEHAQTAKTLAELRITVALLGQQIGEVSILKGQLGELGDVKARIAVLQQGLDDLKKTREEWGRRVWAMAGPILGAVVGVLLGYYLRR